MKIIKLTGLNKREAGEKMCVLTGEPSKDPGSSGEFGFMTVIVALSNSVKLSHAVWGHPRWMGHGGEV